MREMVGRALRTLMDDGAIQIERHRIVIVDREMLKQLAML
ncbi:MAG: helix-turn-helix domain-containing protein [Anaerolineae bacterium]